MRSLHFPVPSPACLIAAVLLEFPTLLFSGHAAEPVAAPVPDHERTGTATPQEPGRIAALKKWNEAKFGLFLHWGVYSVYGGTYKGRDLWSAEWIQENAHIPYAEYAQTAAEWNPKDFDAETWVRTARDAGMRYIVITARHHDGFAIYPSKASNYNLFASGAYKGPDPLAALKRACEKHGLLFGSYYLQRIGAWVNPNRAAFEGASQSPFAKTPDWGFVTCREGKVYLIIRSSAASAPVTLPSLNNRLLGARLLSKPETRIDASAGGHEWQVGPVPGHPDGPFVVVELSVEGHPVVAGR